MIAGWIMRALAMPIWLKLAGAVLAALATFAGGARAEPVKIWSSWVVPVSNLPSILFAKEGITRHNGQSYVMEAIRFQGSTAMIGALASGDIDIALLGFSSFSFAIEKAGIKDARLIASEMQDGVPGFYSQGFAVAKDGPIRTIEDLKGKVVAINGTGSAVDIAMRAMLLRHGLRPRQDVMVIEAPFPAMKTLLAENRAVLIPNVPPFSEDPELKAQSRILFTTRDAMGPSEISIWVVRQRFLKKNRAAMVDLLEDFLRALRFYIDPRNHAEAVRIAADFSRLPAAAFDSWLFTKDDFYRDPRGLPNLDALQANIDQERREGFLKTRIEVRKYVDLSLIEEAAKRLP